MARTAMRRRKWCHSRPRSSARTRRKPRKARKTGWRGFIGRDKGNVASDEQDRLEALLTFAHDVLGIFVVAKCDENRLSKFFIASPFSKFDLGDELGVYPMHLVHHRGRDALDPGAALFRWKIDKGTIVPFFVPEFLIQHRQ